MKILVTGVHGFVGGSVGRFATQQGYEVLGLARNSQPPANWRTGYTNIDVAYADAVLALRHFRRDAVVHCAGSASVQASFENLSDDFNSSAGSLNRMLEAVKRSSLRPVVIFPSSAAVYGNSAKLPIAESAPVSPISPYCFHKHAAEIVAQSY